MNNCFRMTDPVVKKKFILCLFIVCGLSALLVIGSCKKIKEDISKEPGPTPYDSIQRNDTAVSQLPVDSLTITYVHNKVLASRCALPACHVGSFEPDFRTPQSSFSTMVYAPIKKNNAAKEYKYRVIPFNVAKSVLYQRVSNCCFVYPGDQMPQDNDTVKLAQHEIDLIARWIENGARDMFGNVARLPNEAPVINPVFFAISTDLDTNKIYSNKRLDSVVYNPFIVPDTVGLFYMGVYVSDDSLALNQIQLNRLKISTDADNFNSAVQLTASYFSAFSIWVITVPASSLPANQTLYMRYYINDGVQPSPTEFPRTDMPLPYKTYWSFIRQ